MVDLLEQHGELLGTFSTYLLSIQHFLSIFFSVIGPLLGGVSLHLYEKEASLVTDWIVFAGLRRSCFLEMVSFQLLLGLYETPLIVIIIFQVLLHQLVSSKVYLYSRVS